ncbi:MAG: hypothetical protein K0R82_3024 [Flavipsychrobacter sp.]|jgi:hypothetical protein|nr:hypothetical protein [Flavipsychrobacter sp.]
MKTALLICTIFITTACSAQKEFDCSAFLAKEITDETPEKIIKECQNFLNCGLDNTDMKLFVQPPAIASLMTKAANDKERLTYGYILRHVQEFTNQKDYKEFKKQPKQVQK